MQTKANNVTSVLEWRRRTKRRLIEAFGGACGLCGYNRCERNLVFHHINPEEKEFSFGHYQSKSWEKVVNEIRKCVMLCHNCHGEVHHGLATISSCQRFDEAYATYDKYMEGKEPKEIKQCLICGNLLNDGKKFCSRKCLGKSQQKADINIEKIADMLRNQPFTSVAKCLGISDNAIRKRIKRAGLDPRTLGKGHKRQNGGSGGV